MPTPREEEKRLLIVLDTKSTGANFPYFCSHSSPYLFIRVVRLWAEVVGGIAFVPVEPAKNSPYYYPPTSCFLAQKFKLRCRALGRPPAAL